MDAGSQQQAHWQEKKEYYILDQKKENYDDQPAKKKQKFTRNDIVPKVQRLRSGCLVKSCFCSSIINLLVILIVFASHIVRSLILCVLKAKIFFLFAYCAENNTRKIPVYVFSMFP